MVSRIPKLFTLFSLTSNILYGLFGVALGHLLPVLPVSPVVQLAFTRCADHGKPARQWSRSAVILQEAFVMKNLLALVGAVVVLVVGLGWYLQWFKFGSESGTPGHPKYNVEVESDKIKADLKKGKETVGEFIKEHETSKGVPAQTTSIPLNPDGSYTLPPLPPLPPLPTPQAPGTDLIPPPPSSSSLPPPPPFVPAKQ
jgi:hypothetical protein